MTMFKDFKPLNPWGRKMPAHLYKKRHGDLYQVAVEDRATGATIRVGPAMLEDAAGMLMAAINGQIALGAEKAWGNPHLVRVTEPAPKRSDKPGVRLGELMRGLEPGKELILKA